jgi:DNA-directed RNA polymerase subunit omega
LLNKPSLKELMKNVDSKYTLVIVASKQARALIENNPDMLASSSINPVSLALKDIADGKINYTTGKKSPNS